MPIYRLYLLDDECHVNLVVKLACADDKAAIHAAEKIEHACRRELWHVDRCLKVFEGRPRPRETPPPSSPRPPM